MHKIEWLNDHGDWINGGWHKNLDHAQIIAEVKEQSGFDTRIIFEGQVVREGVGK